MSRTPSQHYILLTASGEDRPGITAAFMQLIAQAQTYPIKDFGQSVTHGHLSLSIVIGPIESIEYHTLQTPQYYPSTSSTKHYPSIPLLKELLFMSKDLGLALDFEILEGEDLPKIHFDYQGGHFILSCVAKKTLPAEFLRDLTILLAKHEVNINRIDNTHGEIFKAVEFTTFVPDHLDLNVLKQQLIQISDHYSIDIAFIADTLFRHHHRLVVMDMDSTFIQIELMDEMAKMHGVYEEVQAITREAMEGKCDFDMAFRKRLQLLKGFSTQNMQEILERIPITPGVNEFVSTMKKIGVKIALISGGLSFFTQNLKQRFQLDYAFGNDVEIVDGKITGRMHTTIINAGHKATLLELLAQQEGIDLQQVIAVGDGANDIPMLTKAGQGVAFHAKPAVKKMANHQIEHGTMLSLLYFLGIPMYKMVQ